MYKDKDRQKQAQREWVRQKRADQKQGSTLTDACGKEHPIDYEGRRKCYELLESWAKGKGTEHHRHIGLLARHYRTTQGATRSRPSEPEPQSYTAKMKEMLKDKGYPRLKINYRPT